MKIFALILLLLVCLPLVALGAIGDPSNYTLPDAPGLVPCGTGENSEKCTFNDFITLLGNIFNFLVFKLVVPIATLAIAYAGITYVIYPTNQAKRSEAKGILMGAVWGIVLALGAYLIVTTIVDALVRPEAESGYNFNRFLNRVD